jgi:hypothetical protein
MLIDDVQANVVARVEGALFDARDERDLSWPARLGRVDGHSQRLDATGGQVRNIDRAFRWSLSFNMACIHHPTLSCSLCLLTVWKEGLEQRSDERL